MAASVRAHLLRAPQAAAARDYPEIPRHRLPACSWPACPRTLFAEPALQLPGEHFPEIPGLRIHAKDRSGAIAGIARARLATRIHTTSKIFPNGLFYHRFVGLLMAVVQHITRCGPTLRPVHRAAPRGTVQLALAAQKLHVDRGNQQVVIAQKFAGLRKPPLHGLMKHRCRAAAWLA